MFQKAGPMAEKVCLGKPTKCRSLRDRTHSMPRTRSSEISRCKHLSSIGGFPNKSQTFANLLSGPPSSPTTVDTKSRLERNVHLEQCFVYITQVRKTTAFSLAHPQTSVQTGTFDAKP